MSRKHLDQTPIEVPKTTESLTKFGDLLKTSYFYPYATYGKCEDDRVPEAYMQTVGRKVEGYVEGFKYLSVYRVTESTSGFFEINAGNGEKGAIIPISVVAGTAPEVSWKPLVPGYITFVERSFQVSAGLDFVLLTT